MMRRSLGYACLSFGVGAGALALAWSPAIGQSSALEGHNSNAPVDVAADRIEVQDRSDRVVISGNVDVRQAQLRLNAARMTIGYESQGGTRIQRIDATGGVLLRSPSETARSQSAIYDLNRGLVTMLGNVVLNQGPNTVQGGRLIIDLDTGRAVMDGGVAGAPGTASTPNGRVTGRFTVPQRRTN